MIKLNASFSKKVPGSEEYSSEGYMCAVELELSDNLEPEALHAKIHETFDLVRTSVESELENRRSRPTGCAPPDREGGNGSHGDKGNGNNWKCSDRQRDLILKLVDEHDLDRNGVDELARKRFGKGVVDLNKLEASGLIDEIIEAHGGRRRGNGRRFPATTRRVA